MFSTFSCSGGVKIYVTIGRMNRGGAYLANFMVQKTIIYILFLFAFTACKSLQSATKNTSTSATPKNGNKKDVKFLDDIAVTPGSNNKQYDNTASKKNVSKDKSLVINTSTSSVNIENANWLQIKYSILLNVEVENLSNMALLRQIDNWWGTRYCLGGTTGSCIDCSAFTQMIMQSVYNISLPRIARDQYDFTERINTADLKEGDLVFFHTVSRGVSHVGVYMSNNKFVHASTSNGVMISDLNDSYWSTRYIGAGRVPG